MVAAQLLSHNKIFNQQKKTNKQTNKQIKKQTNKEVEQNGAHCRCNQSQSLDYFIDTAYFIHRCLMLPIQISINTIWIGFFKLLLVFKT